MKEDESENQDTLTKTPKETRREDSDSNISGDLDEGTELPTSDSQDEGFLANIVDEFAPEKRDEGQTHLDDFKDGATNVPIAGDLTNTVVENTIEPSDSDGDQNKTILSDVPLVGDVADEFTPEKATDQTEREKLQEGLGEVPIVGDLTNTVVDGTLGTEDDKPQTKDVETSEPTVEDLSAPLDKSDKLVEPSAVTEISSVTEVSSRSEITPTTKTSPLKETTSEPELSIIAEPSPSVKTTIVTETTPVTEATPVPEATPVTEATPLAEELIIDSIPKDKKSPKGLEASVPGDLDEDPVMDLDTSSESTNINLSDFHDEHFAPKGVEDKTTLSTMFSSKTKDAESHDSSLSSSSDKEDLGIISETKESPQIDLATGSPIVNLDETSQGVLLDQPQDTTITMEEYGAETQVEANLPEKQSMKDDSMVKDTLRKHLEDSSASSSEQDSGVSKIELTNVTHNSDENHHTMQHGHSDADASFFGATSQSTAVAGSVDTKTVNMEISKVKFQHSRKFAGSWAFIQALLSLTLLLIA